MKYSSSSVVFLTIFLSLSFSVYGHPSGASAAWDSFLNFTGCQYGDDIAGLSTLKQYFHRFGYIPDSPSNFSDAFDDALEAALKAYQENFNLNASGVLDAATVAQLVQPRCGVPDMVNGSTTMKSGKLNTLNTVAHFTFFSGKPSWGNKKDLTYAFEPSSAQIVDPQVLRTIFTKAFARWSAVTPLTFQEATNYAAADLKIGFFSGDHGDGEPFDGVLGTLAHAYSPTDGRFHLDADEKWSFDEKSIGLTEIDLESVAVHEIGHLLGLGHSSVEGAIMFPTITSGARKVQLAGDDIDGIQQLYGANPSPSGSTGVSNDGPSVQERETSDGGAHIGPGLVRFFGVGLGFYLWGWLMM